MRIATEQTHLDVNPGDTTSVVVDVLNNGQVIDGVSARVIGLPAESVDSQPQLLPLFPETSGQVRLALSVPKTHPAGQRPLTVEVVSHGARLPSQFLDVDLNVAAHPSFRFGATPQIVRARRGGRFVLEMTNDGNVPLDIALQAVDLERSCTATFSSPALRLEPGVTAPVLLDVRGPRMITGGDVDRPVAVLAVAHRADQVSLDEVPAPTQERALTVRLRQRPLISRGVLTALILAGIVALWAAVFLLGVSKIFAPDPMTKAVPASFFAASQAGSNGGSGSSGAGGSGGSGGAAPAGALPKSGQLPPGVGGEITGTVTSSTQHKAVGRILVEAVRQAVGADGKPTPQVVSSAASQTDGTYTLAGLFPSSYFLKFSADGFHTVWYPRAPSMSGAGAVPARSEGTTSGINAVVTGLQASMSGKIDPGDTLKATDTTVVARSLATTGGKAFTARTHTGSGGSYTLHNLPAPGDYVLTFTTEGYQTSTLTDSVTGGENRLEPTVQLGAANGQISGTVSSNGNPLGAAIVTTTVGGKGVTVMTPTTGQVGSFTLTNLPTPATYVITFRAPGHGSTTSIVDLGAGQNRNGIRESLADGTGSVTGRVLDASGHGLGGVSVSVGGATSTGATAGAPTTPTTTTVTDGAVGTYVVNGLAVPGSYTLTFALDGYTPATVPVSLTANGVAPRVDVRLTQGLGSIEGVVRHRGAGFVGATITATNGQQSYTTTSSAAGADLRTGGYMITGLQPGSYSVTVTADNLQQQTRLVTVSPGQTVRDQNLSLGG